MSRPKLQTLKPRVASAQQSRVRAVADVPDRWGAGRGGRPWRRKRDTILLRDRYTCQHCGHIGLDLDVDHILNVARGGTDDDDNLQALCRQCHQAKTAAESRGEWEG